MDQMLGAFTGGSKHFSSSRSERTSKHSVDSTEVDDYKKLTKLEQQVEELKFYHELDSKNVTEVSQYDSRMNTIEEGKQKKDTKKKTDEMMKSRPSRGSSRARDKSSDSRTRGKSKVRDSSSRMQRDSSRTPRGKSKARDKSRVRSKSRAREPLRPSVRSRYRDNGNDDGGEKERAKATEREKKLQWEKKQEREAKLKLEKQLELERVRREEGEEMRRQESTRRVHEEEAKGVAMAKTLAKIGQEQTERAERKILGQHAKEDQKVQQRLKESETLVTNLQSKFDELTVIRDRESKELKAAKKMIKEQNSRLLNAEKQNEEEISELKMNFNDKMDKLAKQFQKMKTRQEDAKEENERILKDKEEWMKSGTEEMQQVNEKHVKEVEALKEKSRRAEENIDEAEENGRKEVEKVKTDTKKRIQTLEERVSAQMYEKLKETEAEYLSMQEIIVKEAEKLKDEVKELSEKRENDIRDLEEMQEEKERRHEEDLTEVQDNLKQSMKISKKLQSKLNEVETESEEIETQLQNELSDKEVKYEEAKSELQEYSESLKEKNDELTTLREKLQATDKSVKMFRTRARTEMEGIKAVVDKSQENQDEVLKENAKEKHRLSSKVKFMKAALNKSENEIEILNLNQAKRLGALKAQLSESESIRTELLRCTEAHQKSLKAKDVQYAREKQKWSVIEQRLRGQVNQTKANTSRQNGEVESLAELRALVENLKSEKSALQLKMVSESDKTNRRIGQLERSLSSQSSISISNKSHQAVTRAPQMRTPVTTSSRSKYMTGKETREPTESIRMQSGVSTIRSVQSHNRELGNESNLSLEEDFDGDGVSAASKQSRLSMRKHIRRRKFG